MEKVAREKIILTQVPVIFATQDFLKNAIALDLIWPQPVPPAAAKRKARQQEEWNYYEP